jgi:hypothetical protein
MHKNVSQVCSGAADTLISWTITLPDPRNKLSDDFGSNPNKWFILKGDSAMPKTTILENAQMTVWYYSDKKIIHHQMHQFAYGDNFRDGLVAGLETLKKYGANKWLSDDRKNPVLRKEDIEWSQAHWTVPMIQAGWKYWAIVQPEKAIAKMNMEKLAKFYEDKGVKVEFFTDPDNALKWLEGC